MGFLCPISPISPISPIGPIHIIAVGYFHFFALVVRKVDTAHTVAIGFVLDSDSPVVSLDDVLDDRQTQSAAFHVMHQAIADAIELLEDLLALSAGDADAVVYHRDRDRIALFGEPDHDLF